MLRQPCYDTNEGEYTHEAVTMDLRLFQKVGAGPTFFTGCNKVEAALRMLWRGMALSLVVVLERIPEGDDTSAA